MARSPSAGTVDPVFEDGFVPPTGAEYFVDTGTSSGDVRGCPPWRHRRLLARGRGRAHRWWSSHRHLDTSSRVRSPQACPSGRAVPFTATVVPASGSDPTGSVSFFANGDPLGSSPVTTSPTGVTSCHAGRRRVCPSVPHSITATYGGDVVFAASTSPALTQVVNPDPTNLTITPSSASPEPGQPVTDTATVSLVPAGDRDADRHGLVHRRWEPDRRLPVPEPAVGRPAAGRLYRDLRIRRDPLHRRQLQRRRGRRREQRLIAPGGRSDPDGDDRRVVVAAPRPTARA